MAIDSLKKNFQYNIILIIQTHSIYVLFENDQYLLHELIKHERKWMLLIRVNEN